MGKKKKKDQGSLGRILVKDRFGGTSSRGRSAESMLHSTELEDGYEWSRLNLQSVTEESSFQEFLSTAELAGTEFQAEKLNIKFVNPRSNVGLLTKDEYNQALDNHRKFQSLISVPRRPEWTTDMTAEQVDRNERDSFLEWRRSLAALQENEGILLTPYEKNLEFWRQLWRVVERSDVVVQIVDARNPLLFRCEDLEKYVNEVSKNKTNLILLNKADFLTEQQRQIWANYFSSLGLKAAFFSATVVPVKEDNENLEPSNASSQKPENGDKKKLQKKSSAGDNETNGSQLNSIEAFGDNMNNLLKNSEINKDTPSKTEEVEKQKVKTEIKALEKSVLENADVLNDILSKIETIIGETSLTKNLKSTKLNSSKLLSREELIEFLKTVHTGVKITEDVTTIGLVGYPNVGKSSTINALMQCKKVSVSATPGKTKHFQTLYLEKDLMLCDCPGLVMPSFVFTKAEMILNGILPVDQMRDHVPPVNLITSLIPRYIIEDKYGILIPKPLEGEDEDRSPTAEELLNAYAFNRGYMTANGQPDNARAARYIIKDFLGGKLLYCHAPPTIEQEIYHTWPERIKPGLENVPLPPRTARAIRPNKVTTDDLDKGFFDKNNQTAHMKGRGAVLVGHGKPGENLESEKPWKKANKHQNKNKKEKLRRVYAHLDQH